MPPVPLATPLPSPPTLYADLLGPAWEALPGVVRRLHREGRATGLFSVRRGRGPLVALIAWLCRMPPAGEQVPTRLEVRRDGALQCWERAFGPHALVSMQRALAGARLAERLGPVECVFRLRPVSGGLAYEQVGARLCLGPLRLPLPRVLAPRIAAETLERGGSMHVHVRIALVGVGPVLAYEGVVTPEEETP